jgi:hypothetical protein
VEQALLAIGASGIRGLPHGVQRLHSTPSNVDGGFPADSCVPILETISRRVQVQCQTWAIGLLLRLSVGHDGSSGDYECQRYLRTMRAHAAEFMAVFRSSVPGSGLLNCLRSK